MDNPLTPRPIQCRICARQDASPCSYVDADNETCGTSWCPDHAQMAEGKPYCRRHAGVIRALVESVNDGHVPDINNRAPSLANWVAKDIDEGIRELLEEAKKPEGNEDVIQDPLTHVRTAYGTHLWERWWKVVDESGIVVVKVGIDVDESNDSEVRVRVGNRAVISAVPPWIGRRLSGHSIGSDQYARQEYYDMLLAAIGEALGVEV